MSLAHRETIEALYLRCPTAEFRMALDRAVAGMTAAPLLAVVSSPFYLVELLRRIPGDLVVSGDGRFDPDPWLAPAAGWAWGRLASGGLHSESKYSNLFWAEPQNDMADSTAAALRQVASPQAQLYIVVSSFLRGYLPAWQQEPHPAQNPLSGVTIPGLLRRAGWQVEQVLGFHSPSAVLWSLAMRSARLVGRPDWEDRARLAMRAAYRQEGAMWRLCPLALIRARAV